MDLERALPDLYVEAPDGQVKEAILDDVVTTPGCLTTTPIDVTIRCTHAARNGQGLSTAAHEPAAAAKDGKHEKLMRYGPSVLPLAFEMYGRVGYKAHQGLCQLAASLASTSLFSASGTAGIWLPSCAETLSEH